MPETTADPVCEAVFSADEIPAKVQKFPVNREFARAHFGGIASPLLFAAYRDHNRGKPKTWS
jgi:hypothetical protein